MSFVFLNGCLLPASEARVSVFDRGFVYGDALFETIKVTGGRPVFLTEHIERLAGGLRTAAVTASIIETEIREQALILAERNAVESGRLRLQVTRGGGAEMPAPDPAEGLHPTVLLTLEPFAGIHPDLYSSGVPCITVAGNRGPYARLKATGLLPTLMARMEGRAQGAWEVIFKDESGGMLEGSVSNVFFLAGKLLLTAPAEAQILPGVIRSKVIAMAPHFGLNIDYHASRIEELNSGEVSSFLTSSLLGLCPVDSIDAVRVRPDEDGLIASMREQLGEIEVNDARQAT